MKKEVQKIDRRIQRTKKLLSDALIALVLEKGYENITIQDIIDKANVGRSTFYAHFESKEQLLFAGQDHLQKALLGNEKDKLDFLFLYKHAAENFDVAKAMLGKKGGDIIISHIQDVIAFKLMNDLKKQPAESQAEQKLLLFTSEVAAAALTKFLTCWLDDHMPFTPEEMADRSKKMVTALFKI